MNNNFPIGCHVSISGGVFNAPKNAADLGCEAFQIFTRSPRGGPAGELTKDVVEQFHQEMEKYSLKTFAVHCPYYINFGSGKPNIYNGSVSVVRQELERSSLLGATYVMTHLGSAKDLGREKAFKQAKVGLTKVLEGYEGKTQFLLEIAAGSGEVLGHGFEDLAELMQPLKKYKTFGGICFDTQHAFSSGYDLRSPKAVKDTFSKFDKIIGLKWLKMSHINDSKPELGARKDRHDHIGEGKIGKGGFKSVLDFFNKKIDVKGQMSGVAVPFPLILETEHDKVELDIKTLKGLRKAVEK